MNYTCEVGQSQPEDQYQKRYCIVTTPLHSFKLSEAWESTIPFERVCITILLLQLKRDIMLMHHNEMFWFFLPFVLMALLILPTL